MKHEKDDYILLWNFFYFNLSVKTYCGGGGGGGCQKKTKRLEGENAWKIGFVFRF